MLLLAQRRAHRRPCRVMEAGSMLPWPVMPAGPDLDLFKELKVAMIQHRSYFKVCATCRRTALKWSPLMATFGILLGSLEVGKADIIT